MGAQGAWQPKAAVSGPAGQMRAAIDEQKKQVAGGLADLELAAAAGGLLDLRQLGKRVWCDFCQLSAAVAAAARVDKAEIEHLQAELAAEEVERDEAMQQVAVVRAQVPSVASMLAPPCC